jgi:hypothetical protein
VTSPVDPELTGEMWAEELAQIIARCRFGPGVDMGGRHNPRPSEVLAAQDFVARYSAVVRPPAHTDLVTPGDRAVEAEIKINNALVPFQIDRAAFIQIKTKLIGWHLSVVAEAVAAERAKAEALRTALLDAEHRIRLLADRTDDYGPEGMRTRLIREYQVIALAAAGSETTKEDGE